MGNCLGKAPREHQKELPQAPDITEDDARVQSLL